MAYVNQNIKSQIKTNVDALKYRAIQKYMDWIKQLEKGYKPNYQEILEIISLVDIYSTLDEKKKYYKDFYING